jgi:hypothetical protein
MYAGPSVNISLGPKEDRVLITGLHTVADVYCNCCQACLGWKYVEAYEESQKYKEGKCIIEKAKMVTDLTSRLSD